LNKKYGLGVVVGVVVTAQKLYQTRGYWGFWSGEIITYPLFPKGLFLGQFQADDRR